MSSYRVVFASHCGMSREVARDKTLDDVKAIVRRMRKRSKNLGLVVQYLGDGQWEFTGDDSRGMVGDDEGILYIKKQREKYRRPRRR